MLAAPGLCRAVAGQEASFTIKVRIGTQGDGMPCSLLGCSLCIVMRNDEAAGFRG